MTLWDLILQIQIVQIDDYFPMKENEYWACIHSTEQECWMMILEKALAKVYGGYHKIP